MRQGVSSNEIQISLQGLCLYRPGQCSTSDPLLFARLASSARSVSSLAQQANATINKKGDANDSDHIKPCKDKKEKKEFNDKNLKEDDCLPEGSSNGISKGDFNGDGIADLAVGVPDEDVNGFRDAGTINVIYGTVDGLHQNAVQLNQFWTESNVVAQPGITAATNHHFGSALAAGKLNGDQFSDLAIGVPFSDYALPGPDVSDAGLVVVLYGSANGLTSVGSTFISQVSPFILDEAEIGDCWNNAVLYGDNPESLPNNGGRLSSINNQFWNQNSAGTLDICEDGDRFGSTLY